MTVISNTVNQTQTLSRKESTPDIFLNVNYAYHVFLRRGTNVCFRGFEAIDNPEKKKQGSAPVS